MNKKLQAIYSELEINRQSLFDKLDSIEDDVLAFRPDAKSWSILQVCQHLIVSEELSLHYINKKLQYKSNIYPAGISSSFRSFLLNFTMRLPFRLPAPQRVSDLPENQSWESLKTRWLKVREGLQLRLSDIPEEFEDKLVYKHPAAGRLTLYHMLTFFRIHINRHGDQISRLIQAGNDLKRRDS